MAGMTPPAEPRWLDDVERDAWIYLLGVMTRLPGALEEQLRRAADLSHFEYLVLAGVSMSPGQSLRMSALADMAFVTLSHLSRVVTRLEKRGLMVREPDPDDGRTTLAVLTDAGREILQSTAPGHVETVRHHVFDRLTPTQTRQLRALCAAIVSGLGQDPLPPFVTPPGAFVRAGRRAAPADTPGEQGA